MRKAILVCAGCLALAAVAWAQAASTMLFDFEKDAEAGAWRAARCEKSVSTEHATSGKQSLKLKIPATGDSSAGIATEALPVRDWSGQTALKFDVFADDAMSLTVSIRDRNVRATGKSYRKDFELQKGANTVVVPVADVGADIDVKMIQAVNLIARIGADRTIYLDNVRLEK